MAGGKQKASQEAPKSNNPYDDKSMFSFLNNPIWIDKIEKELRTQRDWNKKWGFMNDPKLYMGEQAPNKYPNKPKASKWSPFNIINPPLSQHQKTFINPADIPSDNFKVTGFNPHQYYKNTPKESTNSRPHLSTPRSGTIIQHTQPTTPTPSSSNADEAFERYVAFKQKRYTKPQSTYGFPATTSQEYGWGWGLGPHEAGTYKQFRKLEKFGPFNVKTK